MVQPLELHGMTDLEFCEKLILKSDEEFEAWMAGLGLINGSKACDHCQEPMRDCTTIYSDEWRAYRGIVRLPGWLLHRRVRHNRYFVDPVTRYHTQNIERKNGEFKAFMREKKEIHDNQLLSHIAEFLWRERFDHRNGEDVFYNFWSQVAVIYPCTM